jgi:hypothetical protein
MKRAHGIIPRKPLKENVPETGLEPALPVKATRPSTWVREAVPDTFVFSDRQLPQPVEAALHVVDDVAAAGSTQNLRCPC